MALTREHRWTIEVSFWEDDAICAEIWRVASAGADGSVIADLVETCNETTLSGALHACARFIGKQERRASVDTPARTPPAAHPHEGRER